MATNERRIATATQAVLSHARLIFFVWLVISLAVSILMLTGSIYMLQIYGRVLPSNSLETLIALSILMMLMFLAMGILDLVRSRLLVRLAKRIDERLRDGLFNLSARIMANSGNITLARRPHADIEAITGFVGGPAITAFFDAPFMPFYIFIIWLFHPYLALFAIFAAILLFFMALANEYRLRKPQEEVAKTRNVAAGTMHEILGAMEAAKALGMLENIRRRWSRAHEAFQGALLKLRDRSSGLSSMAKAVRLFLQSAMLGLGAWLVLRQEITPGVMIAASIMLGRALYPVENAITHWRSFKQAREAAKRLDADLEKLATMPPSPTLVPEVQRLGKLEAQELFVAPPGLAKPVLRNIGFRLEPGQLMLVTGGNGAGKSTLARALTGLWPPMGTGKVLLAGVDLRGWPEEQLGRHLGYVPQAAQLMTGTIGDNISRFDPAATEEEILAAAKRMGVYEAIKKMGGLNRQVGPAGRLLSAGEQRKVALARAAWNDPGVYVLDEPTADLDKEGRQAFYYALANLKRQGCGIVLIDHAAPPAELVDLHLKLDGNGSGKLKAVNPSRRSSSASSTSSGTLSAGYSIKVARR